MRIEVQNNKIIMEKIWEQLKLWLNKFFLYTDFSTIEKFTDEAYLRCMRAISISNNKYLKNSNGIPEFHLLHSGCWALYLYYLSYSIGKFGGGKIVQRKYII